MRKTDFQMEDELAGNLRTIKPHGPGDLLFDRYDSVFRRNMIEPEMPTTENKKRVDKAKFKWHNKGGKAAEKLNKHTIKKR